MTPADVALAAKLDKFSGQLFDAAFKARSAGQPSDALFAQGQLVKDAADSVRRLGVAASIARCPNAYFGVW